MNQVNLTILMPCLNEEENIAFCINEAQYYLSSISSRFSHTGEVLIVDNNGTDCSAVIAKECVPASFLNRVLAMAARCGLAC